MLKTNVEPFLYPMFSHGEDSVIASTLEKDLNDYSDYSVAFDDVELVSEKDVEKYKIEIFILLQW